ncbi:MAG: HNH endonuclease [Leptospiraceae bacterium]|nr:HNH endonuclease [Leptospiraceae bacterium]MCP5498333.1 HNH endonuclease [Leptospiraceae bacterium]
MSSEIDDSFIPFITEEEKNRERKKAKELKNSAWWKKKKSGGECYYCHKKFEVSDLTMDHLIPLARGGKSIKANLVPACKECNHRKKHGLPFEFMQ